MSGWALDGNNDPILADKPVNVAGNLPASDVLESSATLNAHDIRRLGTQRVRVVSAPGPGRYIMGKEVAIIKTGAAAITTDTAHVGLALVHASDGLLPKMPTQPGSESSSDRSVYQATAAEVLRAGNYVRYVQPTGQMGHLAWADQPLVIYLQAADQTTWDNLTGALVGTTLDIRVR